MAKPMVAENYFVIKGIKRRTRFEYDVGELLCGYMIQ